MKRTHVRGSGFQVWALASFVMASIVVPACACEPGDDTGAGASAAGNPTGTAGNGGDGGSGGNGGGGSGGGNGTSTIRGAFGPNRAPEFLSTPPLTAQEGKAYRYAPMLDDLDGDLLDFEATVKPEGMRVSPSSGAVFWVPGEQSAGKHAVTLRASDGRGGQVEQSWQIDVTAHNAPPKITSTPNNIGATGTPWQYQASAADPDGDTLSWELVQGPNGMTVNGSGLVSWPSPAAGGSVVHLRVKDPGGLQADQRFQVAVPVAGDNAPPVITIASPASGAVLSGPTPVIGTVSDAALARFTVSACAGGACKVLHRGSIPVQDAQIGVFDTSVVEPGDYDLVVDAEDAGGLTASASRPVTVKKGTQAGAIRIDFIDLVIQKGNVDLTVLRGYDSLNDADGDFGVGWKLSTGLAANEAGLTLPPTPLYQGWSVGGSFLNPYIQGSPKPLTFKLPDGREYDFYFIPEVVGPVGGGYILAEDYISGTPGTSVVAYKPNGQSWSSTDLFWQNGTTEIFDYYDFDYYDPAKFDVNTEFGEKYTFLKNGDLQKWTDENGNTFSYDPSGMLIGPDGPILQIEKNAAGKITKIADADPDPSGPQSVTYEYENGDLVKVTFIGGDDDGTVQTFEYDGAHEMVSYDAPGARAEQVEYDEKGRVIRFADGEGNVTEYTYDDATGKKTVTSPSGASAVFEHDAAGNVTKVTDPLGGVTFLEYDANGHQTKRIDPLGNVTETAFDADGNALMVKDGLGNERTATYDAEGRILTAVNENGNAYGFSYTPNTVQITAPNGQIVEKLTYDDDGNLVQIEDGMGLSATMEYDTRGRQTKGIYPSGEVYSTTYDAKGLTATTTAQHSGQVYVARQDVSGNIREMTSGDFQLKYDWNMRGDLRSATDPLGRKVELKRDGNGRVKEVGIDGEIVSKTRYDADGNPVSQVEPSGRAVRLDYDVAGRVTAVHSADGISTYAYDAAGRVTSRTTPLGDTVTASYDAAGRTSLVQDAAGRPLQYGYDPAGNLTTIVDPEGRTTTMTYNSLGHLTGMALPGMGLFETTYDERQFVLENDDDPPVLSRTRPTGEKWSYSRGPGGRLDAVVDPQNNQTTFSYTGELVSSVTLPGNRVIGFGYTGDNLTSMTLPSGATTTWTYDAGLLSKQVAADGTTVDIATTPDLVTKTLPGNQVLTWSFDDANLTKTTSPDAEISYGYDPQGRVAVVTDEGGAKIQYAYDGRGNPAKVDVTAPDGAKFSTTYEYDSFGRLTKMTDPDGGQWVYSYDMADRLVEVQRPNGTTTSFHYESELPRPTSIEHKDADGDVLRSFGMAYDAGGRLTHLESDDGVFDYTYDASGRLASEAGQGAAPDASYEYDVWGNLISRTVNGSTQAATYDEDDQLLTFGGLSFSNDGRGNRTNDGSRSFSYDAENRLASVSGSSGAIKYLYDADGQLAGRAKGGQTVRCLYAPSPITGQSECAFRYDAASGAALDVFVFDRGGVASRHGATGARYVHRGLLESVTALTDSAGAVKATYSYDPWGKPRGAAPAEPFLYGYTGALTDPDTGLVYLRSRWYDPATSRFLTADTAPAVPENPESLNRYAYTQNDPLNHVDPRGTFTTVEISVTSAIQTTLAGIRTLAVQCLSAKARKKLVFAIGKYMVTNFVIEPALSALTGGIASWIKLSGEDFAREIMKMFCQSPPIFTLSFGVKIEVPVDDCGKEITKDAQAGSCADIHKDFKTGPISRIDIVAADVVPIEIKRGKFYKSRQLVRFCRAGARYGSHVLVYFLGDWPPTELDFKAGKWLGSQLEAAKKCFNCWHETSTLKLPKGCRRKALGSIVVFTGWDRSKKKFKISFPDPSDLGCL